MAQGQVKWFDMKKGYGFIKPEGGQADIFVHLKDVERSGLKTLEYGQNVEYQTDIRTSKKYAGKLYIREIKILNTEQSGDA